VDGVSASVDGATAAATATGARTERKLDELHQDVVGVRIALAGLTAELKAANAAQSLRDATHERDRKDVEDHELRLRQLEARVPEDLGKQLDDGKRFRWMLVGSALAGGSALGGLAGALVKF
jgi:hypothetical protein